MYNYSVPIMGIALLLMFCYCIRQMFIDNSKKKYPSTKTSEQIKDEIINTQTKLIENLNKTIDVLKQINELKK